jgi:hypothetical protein
MKILLTIIVFAGLLPAALALLRARGRSTSDAQGAWPFHVRKPMTSPEQVLYFRLLQALPAHIVLAQVQLSRFLGVTKGQPSRPWLNRIDRLSVDFLVLDKDASVVAAIELDDKSHERPDRREADSRKDRALAAAGVPLLRWNVARMPGRDEIVAEVASAGTSSRASDPGGRVEPMLGDVPGAAVLRSGGRSSRRREPRLDIVSAPAAGARQQS